MPDRKNSRRRTHLSAARQHQVHRYLQARPDLRHETQPARWKMPCPVHSRSQAVDSLPRPRPWHSAVPVVPALQSTEQFGKETALLSASEILISPAASVIVLGAQASESFSFRVLATVVVSVSSPTIRYASAEQPDGLSPERVRTPEVLRRVHVTPEVVLGPCR